jgi:hypothetical protein
MGTVDGLLMAESMKTFPFIVLGVLLALGALLYVAMKFGDRGNPVPEPHPGVPLSKQLDPKPVSPSVDAPAPAGQDPGAKILEGADRAFQQGFFETALKFYLDFDLRYAGSDIHEKNVVRVWERIRLSANGMPKKDETIPAQLEARRKLHADWTRLKAAADRKPEDLKAFLAALPPKDGRRPRVEAWLEGK